MSPRKLTADDKVAIVELYREPGQTTSTVAEQYDVSVSTISRLLKSELSSSEYDSLVRQKRGAGKDSKKSADKSKSSVRSRRTVKKGTVKKATTARKRPATVKKSRASASEESFAEEEQDSALDSLTVEAEAAPEVQPEPVFSSEEAEEEEAATVDRPIPQKTGRKTKKRTSVRRRRRSSAQTLQQLDIPTLDEEPEEVAEATPEPEEEERLNNEQTIAQEAVVESDEELESIAEAIADDDGGVDEEFEEDFESEEEEEDEGVVAEEEEESATSQALAGDVLEILPITDADLSRMLYLVIDRTAELITCPMQEFRDLGPVPASEESLKTLPIFDNHRIARRFSKRNQRVIKVPDGRLLAKTAPWLEAKGITRCLLDGQVYSLETVAGE